MNVSASLRQKWLLRKTYKRVQKLWDEYVEVSGKECVSGRGVGCVRRARRRGGEGEGRKGQIRA